MVADTPQQYIACCSQKNSCRSFHPYIQLRLYFRLESIYAMLFAPFLALLCAASIRSRAFTNFGAFIGGPLQLSKFAIEHTLSHEWRYLSPLTADGIKTFSYGRR